MKVMVTGGRGFFGLHLVGRLKQAGCQIRVIDRVPPPPAESGVEHVAGDVRDPRALSVLCRGMEVVYHCASLVPLSLARRGEFLRVNVDGTRNVLQSCLEAGVRKVIFVSSSAVYGLPSELPLTESSPRHPLGRYGESKRLAEEVCAQYKQRGLDVSVIRPRTLIGEGRLGIIHLLFNWVSLGKTLYLLGPGTNRFQLLSARDCAEGCWLASRVECFQEDFNLGAERFATLREDLEALARHAGTGSRFVSAPAWLGRSLLRTADLLRLSPLLDIHYELLDKGWYFDAAKARSLLGWQPRDSNAEMLQQAYDWYTRHAAAGARDDLWKSPHQVPVAERALAVLRWLS